MVCAVTLAVVSTVAMIGAVVLCVKCLFEIGKEDRNDAQEGKHEAR